MAPHVGWTATNRPRPEGSPGVNGVDAAEGPAPAKACSCCSRGKSVVRWVSSWRLVSRPDGFAPVGHASDRAEHAGGGESACRRGAGWCPERVGGLWREPPSMDTGYSPPGPDPASGTARSPQPGSRRLRPLLGRRGRGFLRGCGHGLLLPWNTGSRTGTRGRATRIRNRGRSPARSRSPRRGPRTGSGRAPRVPREERGHPGKQKRPQIDWGLHRSVRGGTSTIPPTESEPAGPEHRPVAGRAVTRDGFLPLVPLDHRRRRA